VISKILRTARRLLARYPANPRVAPIRQALLSASKPAAPESSMVVAVEGVEDPLFFALFSALVDDLRSRNGVKAELLQVRSINGAIGVGHRAAFERSWLNARCVNDQWARAHRELVGPVAYRCQPPLIRLPGRDRRRAQQLWQAMQASERPELLEVDGIVIGDLLIDSYLRFRPSPRFDASDSFVFQLIRQALRDLRLARAYFERRRPAAYLSTYTTYVEHGVPARVAVALGIPVRVYGNLNIFGKKLTRENTYHTPEMSGYRLGFEQLSDKAAALEAAQQQLDARLSGVIDSATSYMRVSAYARSDEAVPNVDGTVVIFLHDFYDSPHIYHDLVFKDFWDWICFTIETLEAAGIPYWIKPHPNQIDLSSDALDQLKQAYPGLRLLSPRITNGQLAEAGMLCGVTVYGTVAHELAYLGVPSIACARHPHHSFDFCRTAKTVEEYAAMLRSPGVKPLPEAQMREQALAFYFMHNLEGSTDKLAFRPAFSRYWKTCNSAEATPHQMVEQLMQLRAMPLWQEHLQRIEQDIRHAG